jgi:Radical SAM superfamily
MARVLLVAMPWNRADYPSIQVGLLKGHLVRHGVPVRALYPYLDLERRIGRDLYLRLADKLHPVLGESFFAAILAADADMERLGDRFLLETEELDARDVASVRSTIRGFVHDLVEADCWSDVDLVGFTCSFNQVYSSLLAARELKRLHPRIRTVFGGTAMHRNAGRSYFDSYDFIDYLVSGPGEEALIQLATAPPSHRTFIEAPPSASSGAPDFDEFFSAAAPSPRPAVVLSASRGCNFGRCAFCAQNNEPGYSRRDPTEVLREVAATTRRYHTDRVEFSDTCFPFEFLRGEWPARMGMLGARCFAQVRTFTSFSQAAAMRRAGFDQVQVGIESFNGRTLTRMNKPAGLLANIQCLRVAYASDIDVGYNLILDFPGTTASDLREMAALLPAMYHLQPPTALVPFALHDGSEVQRQPSQFGVTGLRPHHYYDAVAPDFARGHLVPLFYDFECVCAHLQEELERIDELCRTWISVFDPIRPILAWSRDNGSIFIHDRRNMSSSSTYVLPDVAARTIELLDQPCARVDLAHRLGDESRAREGLEWLRQRLLIVEDDQRALALPIEDGPRSLRPPDELDSYFAPTSSRGLPC